MTDLELWLCAAIGILVGGLSAALWDVQSLHAKLMQAWVVVHTLRQQLRDERRILIATRDAMMCKLCAIREKSDDHSEIERLRDGA